jgi:outer membrane protein assembly factor BamD
LCGVLCRNFVFLLLLAAPACATTLLRGTPTNAEETYAVAMQDLEDGLYPEAITGFSDLKTRYPYSKLAALADLRIADTHFERGKFVEAIDAYRAFLKFHPNHAEAAYAMFRVAEANFEQIPEDWWFLPPSAEKDQASTRLAISAYRDLLARYPNQTHSEKGRTRLEQCRQLVAQPAQTPAPPAVDACRTELAQQDLVERGVKRMDECRRKLADHELYAARFYFKRERYRAAAVRAEGLLRDYPGLGLDADALWLSARAYLALDDRVAARTSLERLVREFVGTAQAEDAAALLPSVGAQAPTDAAPTPSEGS